jgi:hypothetical protein
VGTAVHCDGGGVRVCARRRGGESPLCLPVPLPDASPSGVGTERTNGRKGTSSMDLS